MTQHIAFVVGTLGGGGAERAVANLASELARRGRRVSIGVFRPGGGYTETLHPAASVHHLAGKAVGRLRAIDRWVRTERPDLVFSPLFETDVYVLASKRLFRWPAKVAVCVQNSLVQTMANDAPMTRLFVRIERRLAKGAVDQWFAISQGAADEAADFFGVPGETITVIPNPVVDEAQPRPRPVDLKALFGGDIGKVLIASGRLSEQKDYPTLLRALAFVRETRPDVGLVVLGEGRLRAALEALAAELGVDDAVRFAGFQTQPLDWMAGADVFVLSSLWEGLANVLIEALWCGLPIVSTDCPHGPAEVLENGRHGLLTPPGDPRALAAAILEVLERPHDRAASVRRAEDFDVAAIADRYEAAFARL